MYTCFSEFCDAENLYDDELTVPHPEASSLEYEITKAPEHQRSGADGLVVYCVDVSGSMQIRTEVPQLQC